MKTNEWWQTNELSICSANHRADACYWCTLSWRVSKLGFWQPLLLARAASEYLSRVFLLARPDAAEL